MNPKKIDSHLKQLFEDCAEQFPASENRFLQIKAEVKLKEENSMKSKLFTSKKAKLIFVAAAICVVSLSCYAGVKIKGTVGSTSRNTEVTEFSKAEDMAKKLDFTSKFVETFDNNFTFSSANISENQSYDEDDNVVSTYKTLYLNYAKDNVTCNLSIAPVQLENHIEQNMTQNGIGFNYSEDNYLFVSDESMLTEQDKQLQAEGKLEISYGGDAITEPEYTTYHFLSWEEDDVIYSLFGTDSSLTQDLLLDMADQIINQ